MSEVLSWRAQLLVSIGNIATVSRRMLAVNEQSWFVDRRRRRTANWHCKNSASCLLRDRLGRPYPYAVTPMENALA